MKVVNIRNFLAKISLLFVFSLCITETGYSQFDELGKWQVKTGISSYYINSLPSFDKATDFSTEIGYRMKTGFGVGVGYSMTWVKTIYSDGFDGEGQVEDSFDGLEGQEIHHAIRLLVNRHFLFGDSKRHVLGIGTGAVILGEQQIDYAITPTAVLEFPDGERFYQYEVHQYKQDRLFHIPGFLFNADYLFRMNENIALGLRLEGLFLFDFGFDRYNIGPKFSAFF